MADLTIQNWERGIGVSPYAGFSQMVNVDIYSKPGCLKISNKLAVDANSASVVTGLIKWMAQDPSQGDIYAVDDSGIVYKRDNGTDTWSVIAGNTLTAANGEGLAIWKGYLFVARRTKLDVFDISNPTNNTGNWVNGWINDWEALDSSFGYDLHPIMAAQNDFMYVGNAQYVDTLEETFPLQPLPFDPDDTATYSYSSQSLLLRSDYRVTCLDEQGSLKIIGTLIGLNGVINIADIFIWDGTSELTNSNGTIRLVENGVQMIKNVDNTIFALAGTGVPRIFQAVTSQSIEAKRFNNIEVPFSSQMRLTPGAIEYKEGEVLFGIGSTANGISPVGVYSLRDRAYVLRYSTSTGRDYNVRIGCIKTISRNKILVSWRDSLNTPVYGVDILEDTFYTGYTAYVDSAIYSVATSDDPITFEKCEIRLGKALKAGDKVKIQARYDLDGTFTDIAVFDTVLEPGLIGESVVDDTIENLGYFKNFQARILLDVGASEEQSIELMSVSFN